MLRETNAELGKLWLQNYAWKDTIIVERQRATIKCQSSSLCQRAIGLLLIRISFQCSNWFPVAVGPRNILPSNWSSVLWAFSFFTATKRLVWWRIPTGMWKVRVSLKTGLPLGSFVRVFFCFSTLLSWVRDTSTYAARKEIIQGQLALKIIMIPAIILIKEGKLRRRMSVSNCFKKRKKINIIIIRSKFFFLFIGQEPTTWPANNCLQIMACSCSMPSNSVWLQIIFCSARYRQITIFCSTSSKNC